MRVHEQQEFAGLAADSGRLVSQFSDGMVRRQEIAQATLHRPHDRFSMSQL